MARSISIHVIFTLSHEDLDSYFGAIPFQMKNSASTRLGVTVVRLAYYQRHRSIKEYEVVYRASTVC
jgi:hypothetical protein